MSIADNQALAGVHLQIFRWLDWINSPWIVLSLVVAYWVSYGFTLSGLAGFIRSFGQVFTPAVCVILALKIILLCLTVTLIPVASTLNDAQQSPTARSEAMRSSAEMRSLVRMAALVLLVEVASLVGNYA